MTVCQPKCPQDPHSKPPAFWPGGGCGHHLRLCPLWWAKWGDLGGWKIFEIQKVHPRDWSHLFATILRDFLMGKFGHLRLLIPSMCFKELNELLWSAECPKADFQKATNALPRLQPKYLKSWRGFLTSPVPIFGTCVPYHPGSNLTTTQIVNTEFQHAMHQH